MIRYKQFVGSGQDLERMVNHWLAEYEPDVTHMAQSPHSDGVLLSFLYDESFRGQELRFEEEHGTVNVSMPHVPADDVPLVPIQVPEEPGDITTDVHPNVPPTPLPLGRGT